MSKRFELLVFDWDGTLMDSTPIIVSCIQASAADLGLPVPDQERASHVIGLGLKDALSYAVPELAEADYGRMSERYRYHFLKHGANVPLFPGTVDMLAELSGRGHLLGIATGKSTAGLDRSLEATGIKAFFAATRCADRCSPKPAPDMLHELMDEFGVDRAATLMIGDTSHDLQMAANAGVASVAVCHGAHAREKLIPHNPLACMDNTAQLNEWLRSNA